ncbi:MAG: oligosaccharide flippase family protein, partial [Clostridia bacterium]|nr:oligosaccharide flippase family protein [Clostridia bacterium]
MITIKAKLENLTIAKPAKAGIFYITTNVFTKLISLLATPLFTRLLLPAEYGVYSLYISWMGIISVIMALGISGGAIYRALGRFRDNPEDLISSAIGILLISVVALSALALVFGEWITGLPPHINSMLIFEVFLNSAEMIVFAHCRYKYSYVKICLINLLYAVLSVGVAIILIYFTPIKAEARIYSSFFASLVLILPLIRKYLRPNKLYNKKIWEYLLRLSLPLLPSALSTALIA